MNNVISTLIRFVTNLFKLVFKVKPSRGIEKRAKKEVQSEKESGGINGVAGSTSSWFRRNRK